MITIGRLAKLAQTTVRTVRHYHRLGILAEPVRDASGYRRYGASELVRLLQIRNLAEAGVALAEIPALIDQAPSDRHTALDALDAELVARIAAIEQQRSRLAAVRSSLGGPPLADEVGAAWQRLAELGIRAESLAEEQEATMLLEAFYGDALPAPISSLYARVLDPGLDEGRTVRMYRRMDEIRDLPADHPEVTALIEETIAFLEAAPGLIELIEADDDPPSDDEAVLRDYIATLPEAHARMITELAARFAPAERNEPTRTDPTPEEELS